MPAGPRSVGVAFLERSEALAEAAFEGGSTRARIMRAKEVEPDHLLEASGYLFACPENLATMSGEMKEMFDRRENAIAEEMERLMDASPDELAELPVQIALEHSLRNSPLRAG